ncbi:uncharacterized protein BO66DRAFT_88638 [Aspergillus aculeatinus CBS 121060]|uniref:Uncharacterized protein n=1 Tax=Aspergillus aculeatinus CBS 121060 TaxID=1448322 RepID=A0ACD1H9N0_9EURO|nr:hypothetical protein BO66DRAFT_88638 [Aspergillus aculeatinus CBS 121060]RAH70123.1 hypothetical protein BO66DRAFT_88638 [Aspergillus aculeatinus CBS 121060]
MPPFIQSSTAKYIVIPTPSLLTHHHLPKKERKENKQKKNHNPQILCTPENAESVGSSVDIADFDGGEGWEANSVGKKIKKKKTPEDKKGNYHDIERRG